MMKFIFSSLLLFTFLFSNAQKDTAAARIVINKLTSKEFAGRGYVNKGIETAATYLNNVYNDHSLKPFKKKHSYSQFFTSPINTFPAKMIVIADGKELIPGVHYIVSPESKGIMGGFMLFEKDSLNYKATDLKREVPLTIKKVKK
ncbi:MAG: hypothetical protein ACOVLD_08940, partial [Bacteroidia bacterium]